jgi:large repetitive protein
MRFPKKDATARTTAFALALALVAVVITALPASAATVTSFTPTCGIAGTAITITGTGFTNPLNGVDFDATGSPVAATTFAYVSATSATATVPVGATSGKIRVRTPVPDSSSATNFIVAADALPTISSFLPTSGGTGTSVVITGTNFGCATSVLFNATSATFVVDSATQITATVPAGATTGALHVTTTGFGPGNSATSFTVTGATPTITSFLPTSGPVGTSVVITGTNLSGVTSVKFNGTSATFSANTATSVTAIVPAAATTGAIQVTASAGIATSSTNFTVTGGPTITSFTPTSGSVGTSVVITGTNLTGVTAVKFNGTAATFTTSTATSVTATVPTGATTGKITVTTPGGTATSLTDFTVATAPVTRTVTFGFDPHSRVSGSVTVSGLAACHSFVPVVIQKQKGGSWKWVDTTATTASGSYKTYIPPSNGQFRAKVNQITLVNGVVCGGDISSTVHS